LADRLTFERSPSRNQLVKDHFSYVCALSK
jgi:hypothetical protein